ncbi:MAG: UDP-N-acetylmuramoyl-L-alanine--D-glutamate ligase [Actinomycetota bacterium]|nr:UDP-N-acetylmuramoyl-L-alanine--D-glutamate ligase [Actinomycetota bacterium]
MTDFDWDAMDGAAVLIGGYGVAGRSAYRLVRALGAEVVVFEDGGNRPEAGVEAISSLEELAARIGSFDLVVPSPGISPAHLLYSRPDKVASELSLARRYCDVPLIAVTGTNGKTTVTTLVSRMLSESGIDNLAVGNIGEPISAHVLQPPSVLVVEASSFQLAYTDSLAPAQAAFLNFAPDHLDWHGSMEAYLAAKARIAEGMAAGAPIWVPAGDERIAAALASSPGAQKAVFGPDAEVVGGKVKIAGIEVAEVSSLRRSFPHDLVNFCFAGAMAMHAGADPASVRAVMEGFAGLPHRMELVGEVDGHVVYNDSKATTPDAVLCDMASIGHAVLITGGRNKGVDLGPLASLAPRLTAVIAMGEAAGEVAGAFGGTGVDVVRAGSMDEAVDMAFGLASPGDAVVLGPACTSWDSYKSYAARGEDFRRAVHERGRGR